MITDFILNLLLDMKMVFFSLLPTLSTPIWAYEHLDDILRTIMGFNYYLPVFELIGLVLSVLVIHLSWKIRKDNDWFRWIYRYE